MIEFIKKHSKSIKIGITILFFSSLIAVASANYTAKLYTEQYKQEIDGKNKSIKQLEKELDKTRKENSDLETKVVMYKKEVKDIVSRNAQLEFEQNKLNETIKRITEAYEN